MFGVLNNKVAVPPTAIFSSFDVLWKDLTDRMTEQGYKIVKARSQKSKAVGVDNEMSRCDLVCHRGGRPYTSKATKVRAWSKKTGCPWAAKASHRKVLGGWVLTVLCDQHNHPPGTPEPPEKTARGEMEDEEEQAEAEIEEQVGPRPDPDTTAALNVAGVSDAVLKLTGDTFNQFKNDYRSMSQAERFGILSQLQMRIAAIYAIQNEELQRQQRAEARERQHAMITEQKLQKQRDAQYAQWQQIQAQKTQAEALPRGKRALRWNEPNASSSLSPATTAERAYGRQTKKPRTEEQQFQASHNTEAIFPIPDD